jgi:hypothetical protein
MAERETWLVRERDRDAAMPLEGRLHRDQGAMPHHVLSKGGFQEPPRQTIAPALSPALIGPPCSAGQREGESAHRAVRKPVAAMTGAQEIARRQTLTAG